MSDLYTLAKNVLLYGESPDEGQWFGGPLDIQMDYTGIGVSKQRQKQNPDGSVSFTATFSFGYYGSGGFGCKSLLLSRFLEAHPQGRSTLINAFIDIAEEREPILQRDIHKWFKTQTLKPFTDIIGDMSTLAWGKPVLSQIGRIELTDPPKGIYRNGELRLMVVVTATIRAKRKTTMEGPFDEMSDRELLTWIDEWAHNAPENFWMDGETSLSYSALQRQYLRQWREWPPQKQLSMLKELKRSKVASTRRKIIKSAPEQVLTKSLQSLPPKAPRAKSNGSLNESLISAAYYAKKLNKDCYAYQGNSYMHSVWRVSPNPSDYLDSINNTGSIMYSVTPELEAVVHTLDDRLRFAAESFKPPRAVADAAAKGLEYRSKASPSNKGGLTTEEAGKQGIGSGVQRATNLKNRDNVSPETINKMVSFFARHEKNKSVAPENKATPWNDKGHVAWLLWGGDAGKEWSNKMKSQMKKQASNPFKLASLLGLFRAVHWQHWTSHWASEGEGYYGDHQLFERLYDGMVDEIDGLAEKVVAKYGSNVVDTVTQTETMMAFLKRWAGMQGTLISKALAAEGDLLKALGNTVSSLKSTQDISMGLEAHLSDLMDKHETNVYLLGQRAKGSVSRIAARHLGAAHKDARKVAYVVLKWMGVDDDEWDGWYAEWQDAEHDIVGHSELTYNGLDLSRYVRKDFPKVLRILKSAFPGAEILRRDN